MDSIFGSLVSIDYVIIGAYMAGVLVSGSYFAKYIQSTGDFVLADRALPFRAIVVNLVCGSVLLVVGIGMVAVSRKVARGTGPGPDRSG